MPQYNPKRHPTLRRGSRGDAVVRMQRRLVKFLEVENEDDFVDGVFGGGTEREVRDFQRQRRLSSDGIVGEATWRALLREDTGGAVPSGANSSGTTSSKDVGQTSSAPDKKMAAGAMCVSSAFVDRVKRCLKRKGYEFFDDNQAYYLNIIGIRSDSVEIDRFDDEMVLIFRNESLEVRGYLFPITTDPGARYTKSKLLNPKGAAILQPGQYINTHRIDKHRGKYDALCQRGGKVKVWRDGNKDDKLDRSGATYEGYYGINIHRAKGRGTTNRIGPYSAGCQVFQNKDDFDFLMDLAKRSRKLRGNKFSYTLIEKADLK